MGVLLDALANSNLIGGARNVISGNTAGDISIDGAGTSGNLVQGNFIGTNAAGTGALVGRHGVSMLNGASSNVIGNNLISGHSGSDNVLIEGAGTSGNLVQGNFIGTDISGTVALSVVSTGVFVALGATGNVIGGTVAGARNIISGSGGVGVGIAFPGAAGNLVQGNYIGTDVTGTVALGNSRGVFISNGATGNVVGGTAAGAGNVISGHTGEGLILQDPGTSGNMVQGNFIGTNAAGTGALPNGTGVLITIGATNNIVGLGNVISGNTSSGVRISGAGTSGNIVRASFIGTDKTGLAPLANGGGVSIESGAANNTIGGTVATARNVISGNGLFGVSLRGLGTTGNMVQGNFIGPNAAGQPLGNFGHGVYITENAANNMIGGTVAGAGNVIAYQQTGPFPLRGVLIGSDSGLGDTINAGSGNSVLGNSIFANSPTEIDLGPDDGSTPNDSAGHSGPNNFLNFPVLNFAFSMGGETAISVTFNESLPNTTLRIEFFSSASISSTGFVFDQTFVGFATVRTNNGSASLLVVLPTALPSGNFLMATATDSDGNTSEFSAALKVV
jgi:titin